jgi:hypothetical protein
MLFPGKHETSKEKCNSLTYVGHAIMFNVQKNYQYILTCKGKIKSAVKSFSLIVIY